jgi:hypothetical protein
MILVLSSGMAMADWPPPFVNYQGVLRDNLSNPLDGTYDMVFRFYTDGGEEILIDRHTTAQGGAIVVSDGLFTASLGGGVVEDGSGPGTYTVLWDVFRDYQIVYLEVQIGADDDIDKEILAPRTRILAAAYAMNSSSLGGLEVTSLLRSDGSDAYTTGTLTFNPGTTVNVNGALNMNGALTRSTTSHVPNFNADLLDGQDSLFFVNTSTASQTKIGPFTANAESVPGATGIQGRGPFAGGFFSDSNGTGSAYVGYGDYGIAAWGNGTGGYFEDTNASAVAYVAVENIGIDARGNQAGAYFADTGGGSYAYVGYGTTGIEARGSARGGYFRDTNNSGYAYVGSGDYGISAYGNTVGGYFSDPGSTGYAYVGYGTTGIEARGSSRGGYFRDTTDSGYALVGSGDRGIEAYGSDMGGYFSDSDGTSYAYAGHNTVGLWGYGEFAGGRFEDTNGTGQAYVATGNEGISAYGSDRGGSFSDLDNSGEADIAEGDRGIWARGNFAGGTFSSPNGTTFWSDVATPTHKITGTGAVGFVQNHPFDASRVLYYSAPEGDEVAVYTRGTARLVAGETTVSLGETFRWVANPDIGLTAHLTPHGDCLGLYVAALSPEELVVREMGGGTSDVVFDYIVYGLRIGYEELAVVETKRREAPLPASEVFDSKYAADTSLRRFNALERYKDMEADVRGVEVGQIHLNGASALREAIAASSWQQLGRIDPEQEHAARAGLEPSAIRNEEAPATGVLGVTTTLAFDTGTDAPPQHEIVVEARSPYPTFPISEEAEPGDLLTLDPGHSGKLIRAATAQDPGIVGIAADAPAEVDGELRVALVETNFAAVKADAGYGEIRPGDLLTSSFTPGHAMLAHEIMPGTIIGKALEPLENGTGLIKVLVMPR